VLDQYEIDQIAVLFGKHVKDSLSTEDVEYARACYLAKSKHNDVVYRNSVLEKVVRFMNQYGWHLSDDFRITIRNMSCFVDLPPPLSGVSFWRILTVIYEDRIEQVRG